MKYEFLPHTADIKIRVYGKDLKEIITNSLLALKEFLGPKLTKQKRKKEIKIEGQLPDLLIDFLSEVLAQTYIEKAVFNEFQGEIDKNQLKGKISGFKFKNLSKDIKAITYHQTKLHKKDDKFIFEFLVDI